MTTTTPVSPGDVPLDQIEVDPDANARRRFDDAALSELAASIQTHGLIQPLVVTPTETGYRLIAGERRYRAAKLAGLTEVPVTVTSGNDAGSLFEISVDENLHRRDLDPIEEAVAFDAIVKRGKLSRKQLAERLSKSTGYVSERLRLLQLPDLVQRQVADGTVPTRLAKRLIEIAKVSEPVAVACAALVAKGEVEPDDLEERPERVIGYLGDHDWAVPQPVALAVSSYNRYPLDTVPLPADTAGELRERHVALGGDVRFCFDQQDADAARSYGCLLEFKNGSYWSSSFITDPTFIADRVRLKLDQHEHEQKKDAKRADRAAAAPPDEAERLVEQRKVERQARAEAKEAAVSVNFELGRKLQLRYDAPKITLPVAKLLALLILDGQADRIAGRGLRYAREDWQVVEQVERRGKPIEKRRYPSGDETAAQLYAWIIRARTPEQVIGRLLQALIAAHAADDNAVARSSRVIWSTPGRYDTGPSGEIPTILDRLAKPVLPRQLASADHGSEADTEAA